MKTTNEKFMDALEKFFTELYQKEGSRHVEYQQGIKKIWAGLKDIQNFYDQNRIGVKKTGEGKIYGDEEVELHSLFGFKIKED